MDSIFVSFGTVVVHVKSNFFEFDVRHSKHSMHPVTVTFWTHHTRHIIAHMEALFEDRAAETSPLIYARVAGLRARQTQVADM